MNKKSKPSNANLLFEELEPRILLSADGLAVITESSVATTQELALGNDELNTLIVQNHAEQTSVVVQAKHHSSELVIIDSRAPNFQQLHNDIIHAQQQGRNIQVIVLDAHRDGIEQISEALTTYNNLDAVHIVSHGESGKLQLGATQLDKQTLKHRSEEIQQWQAAFVDAGDLLLYGCNLAGTTDGQSLVDGLAKQTSTDVAASDDLTGNSILGGDWDLEYQTGDIESNIAFSEDIQDNWQATLEASTPAAGVEIQQTFAEEVSLQVQQSEEQQAAIVQQEQAAAKIIEEDQLQATLVEEQRLEIVFIDESVDNYQTFIDDLNNHNSEAITFEVVLLDNETDGIQQISETLSAYNDVDAVHILSHGNDGSVKLGDTWLSANNLDEYSDSINAWGNSLDESADIMIYGCNLAESESGEQFVNELAQLTGADVAASDDVTGQALLGGDWELEYQVGSVEAQTVVSAELQQTYESILATETVIDDFSTGDFTGNTGSQLWTADWIEVDAGGAGAATGNIIVTGGEVSISTLGSSLAREVDLSGATTATFSFDFHTGVGVEAADPDSVVIEVSDDGGATWTTLEDINYLTGVNSGSKSYDISAYTAVDTQIRFRANAGYGGPDEFFYVDDVQIEYTTNSAPLNSVPGAQTTDEDTNLVFNAVNSNLIFISDADAGINPLEVTLTVNDGVLTLSGTTGLTFVTGSDGSTTMTFTGTLSDINTALDGLTFTPDANFSGSASLQITTHDDGMLLASYSFDDVGNLGADDSTGTVYDGNATGAISVNDATRGDVLSLDGSTHIEIPGFFGNPVDATLAAWVNLTAYDDNGTDIISLGDNIILRYQDYNNSLNGAYYDGATWQNINFLTTINLAGDGWHHVAYSVDDTNNTHTIYFDGVEVASAAMTGSVAYTNGTNSYIGAHGELSPEWDLIGLVDDVRIYDNALTSSEIISVMNNPPGKDSDTVAITVTAVNDAPVLDNTGIMSLSNIKENEIDSSGDLVSDIIASAGGDRITDADAVAVEGIAVTVVDNTNGTWEYSTDGGTNWTAFGSVTNTSAVVLTATGSDRIRFVPSASFSGVVNFTFRAWDTTDGSMSGDTGVNASINGGSTAFSADIEDARVEVLPVEIRILFTTDKDINSSGVPGITSWTTGDVLAIGDPNLSFEPLGSDGSVYRYFNLDTFASDGDMQMQGLHFVSRDVTVGSANSVDLQRGDILFISSNGETMTSTNSLTFAEGDVIAFRPDTPDDYSSGTFIHVLDQPGIQQTTGITLVEADTWVGDITLLGGSFLFTQADSGSGEANNIYHYSADDAGAGTTTGTVSTFITGTDINIDFNEFIGVMLVTQDTPLNGTTVSAGTIITTLANGDSFTGDNSIATNEDEVLTLDVTTTTMGSGTSAADVTVLFDGGDIGLNNNNKKMRSLAFIEIVGPVNVEPVITLPGSGINYTENDPPAVIDATATLVDPDSADFDGGILRVEIASNGTANDRLSVQNEGTAVGQVGVSGNNVTYGGTVIGNFLGGTSASDPLFVYFDANADVTAVQAVMRNITYENTSTSPSTAQRTVNFVISDGDLGNSAVVSTTVDVIDVVTSNAPVATNDPGGYSATVSSYNPPSYWSFDETSGTTASDNGNTANDGTFNGVTLGQTGAINGDTGTAIGFDGSNDYVVMPHDDAYLIDDGTVQLWFNANDLLTDQGLISKDSSGFDTGGHFTIRTLTDGSIEVRLQSTVDSNFLSSGAGTVTAGSWHHVAVTFGAGGMELFLDGVSVDTNPYTGGMGTTSGGIGNYEPIAIGASTRVSGNGTVTPLQDFFGGSIDEVAIIDQALTAEQIQDIYASALQNYTILEDTSLVVSAAEGVLINDSDADGDSLTAVLVAGPSNAASFTLNADGSFSYTPLANFSGTDTFTYMANDGSTNSNVATVTITVNGDNDAPVNTVPGTQTVVEDTQTAIAGLSVADPDAGAGVMTTQLSVTNGVLDVTLSGAATISAGANSSGSMTISGNVTDINATLASLQYMGNLNVNGVAADTLIMVTNDLGNTGTGGALSDTDNVQIDITAVNDAPVARDDRIGLVFDGVDDYVRIGDYAGLTVTTNMTMEAWIKPTGLGTGSKIIINKEGEYELGITADTGEIKWAFDNIDPDWSWHNTGYFAQAGEWTHIAVTYNNGVVNTYANGVVVDTYNGSGPIADNYLAMNELQIGGRENAVTQRFDGQIDEVRIWNTTRAQIDIQNDMNSLLTGVEAGMIGNWRFDEGSGTTVVDQSALGHDGTLADGVTVAEMPSWQGYVVSEEGALNVNAVNGVLPNDYDIDGDILTAVLDSAPVNAASFTLNPDGSFTYTPTANFNGIDSFTYHVNDGSADSNIATVTIRVDPVNDTPTTSPVTLTAIAEDSGVRLITQAELLANAADDDGDVLTATGLSISAGLGTLFDNGDGTWNYTPALNDDASVSFSYTITDGVAPIAGSASLDITPLNDTPTTSPVTLTAIAEDSGVRLITQAELLANAADDDGDVLTATGLSISAGLGTLFDNGDGTWNYTPALNDDTSVSFSYTITDAVAPIAGSATLDITPVNNAPTTTPVTLVAISEDSGVRLITQAELLANAGDVDGDVLTATGLSISAGLGTLFDNGDGTWNYTPALNDDTSVSFSYTITDGVAPIAGSASLDITPLNDTPTTSPVTLTAIAEDSGVRLITQAELLANAADDDGDGLTATGLSISAGLGTLFDNGDGTWNYTPALNDDTSVSFSYTITDGVAPIAGSATLDITPLNDAPVAGNDLPAAVDEGGTVIIDLVANDVDIDNALDLSSIVITVAPGSGALTDNGDGTVSYIHDGSETLSDSFSYTIADITGAVSNTATVNFTVNPLNDAPSALADAQTVNEGGTVNIDLAANDVDVDNALDLSSIVIVGVPPANGTLTVNANGTVDYTHDGSQTTSDNFTYTIADVSGAISNVATVNITVNPVNNAPTTIGIVDVTVAEDSVATSIDLNSVFDDVDNLDSELTYSITGNTSIGLFSTTAINAVTGELVLEYAADMNGSSQIAVRAIDPSGASVETLFTVMVTPVNDAPVMVANSGMSAVGTTNAVITNTELNVSDIDNANNSLTYTVTALPTNGVLMVNGVPVMVNDSFTEDDIVNNRLSYQADATSVNDQFAFIVTDGAGGSISSNTFNIVVQVAPPAPEPIDPVDPPAPTVTPVVPEVEPPSDIGGSVSDPVSTRELEDIYAGGATSTRPQPGLTLEPVQHIALDQAKEVQSDFGGHEVNKSAEVNFSTVSTVADIQVKSIKALWIAIDEMKQQIDEDVTENMTQVEFRAAAVSSSGVALTAGVVAWVLRSGALLTSLMSTIPLWKGYDPLPILAYRDDDDEKEKNVSEDKIPTSLEELKKVKALREKMKKYNQVDSMFGDGKLPE